MKFFRTEIHPKLDNNFEKDSTIKKAEITHESRIFIHWHEAITMRNAIKREKKDYSKF